MGNPILCDDAVGVRLARDFKQQLTDIPDLDVIDDCPVGGLDLLQILTGYERVIVLDAMVTQGGKPGEWRRFTANALLETAHLTSIHDANFATALELGRRVGMVLPQPENIHIFAVSAAEILTFSERMTRALEDRYADYASAILGEVRRLLQD
jgi:hydrogenase maturation protease